MWHVLVMLCLPLLGSGGPLLLNAPQPPLLLKSDPSPAVQSPSTSPGPPVTPTELPTHSEAPALSLNLGLNFKIKVRSQGKGRLGEGLAGTSAKPGLPPTRPAAPTRSQAPSARFWAEALGGSGWLGTSPADEIPSAPGGWAWDAPPVPAEPNLLAPAPTPQPLFPLWPKLTEKGLVLPAGGDSRELEFKIDIDLTAGLGKEGALAPNGSSGGSSGRRYPLLPGLSIGISEIANQLGAPSLFGSTVPPDTWEPPGWNVTGSLQELMEDPKRTPAGALESGPASGALTASPGSGGAFVALPGCPPDRLQDCGSSLPEPGSPSLSSQLQPALPLFVALHSDWNTALAQWGPAWEAHVYGAGSLFALLALLSLLALLCLPCRCPGGGKLLALLHLLLGAAGGARAVLLFGEACGQLELFPDFAVRLLHDLALPCLTSALAVTLLLLLLCARARLSSPSSLRHPCLLAALVLLHFSVATGAILAADFLHQLPFLLLASRGVFALLAALLSTSLLIFYCLAQADAAQIYDLKSVAVPTCRCPFSDARQWSRAACMALPAASCGLLSAALHTYAILHTLGYGLDPAFFGPWPWWTLQLACRLCEAGMGLPLAVLGLYAVFAAPSEAWCPCCCGRSLCRSPEQAAVKTQILPNNFQWGLSQHEKLVVCDTITRSESDYLPLYAVAVEEPGGSLGTGAPSPFSAAATDSSDPTSDFRPPSPIDLRRSIDEALCSEGLFPGSGALYASSSLSLCLTRELSPESDDLCRTASCVELVVTRRHTADAGDASQETTLSSPGPWGGSTCSSSPYQQAAGGAAAADATSVLCPSPGQGASSPVSEAHGSPPRSPPPPGRQYWVLGPVSQESLASVGQEGADAALLQEEFMDVCRQIDALSVKSDTIDL